MRRQLASARVATFTSGSTEGLIPELATGLSHSCSLSSYLPRVIGIFLAVLDPSQSGGSKVLCACCRLASLSPPGRVDRQG